MVGAAGSGDNLVDQPHQPALPDQPLPPGAPDGAYPINEQHGREFQVGGVERTLPAELQLEQLVSYLDATYDRASEQYLALLPDRITHAAMLMLGSAADHAMPGVAFPGKVTASSHELGAVFIPSAPSGVWGISLYDAPSTAATAQEHAWRPEVAGVAELSGVTILDLDVPAGSAGPADETDQGELAARAARAVDFARSQGASAVAVWAFGSSAACVPAGADAYVFTFPTTPPSSTVSDSTVPDNTVPVLVQVANRDEVATSVARSALPGQVIEYHSTHYVATPEESRRRVRDVADFLGRIERIDQP